MGGAGRVAHEEATQPGLAPKAAPGPSMGAAACQLHRAPEEGGCRPCLPGQQRLRQAGLPAAKWQCPACPAPWNPRCRLPTKEAKPGTLPEMASESSEECPSFCIWVLPQPWPCSPTFMSLCCALQWLPGIRLSSSPPSSHSLIQQPPLLSPSPAGGRMQTPGPGVLEQQVETANAMAESGCPVSPCTLRPSAAPQAGLKCLCWSTSSQMLLGHCSDGPLWSPGILRAAEVGLGS